MSPEVAETILIKIRSKTKADIALVDINQFILTLAQYWRQNLTNEYMDGVDGAPVWFEYEHRIWDLGETVRTYLKSQSLGAKEGVLEAAVKIIDNPKYGKGRQSFASLIGDFGGGAYGELLAFHLNDPEIGGHCLKAMLKSKIRGHTSKAEEILSKSRGWIKAVAKKYIDFDKDK